MSEEKVRRRINWLGVVAGLFTLALPLMGAWWRLTLGDRAVIMAVSPFEVEVWFFGGEVVHSPLFWWICLALKLVVVYLGMLLLVGSILTASERRATAAETLVLFSARKLLWLVMAFVAALFFLTVLLNYSSEAFGALMGGAPLQLRSALPYFYGEGSVVIELANARFSAPVRMTLTLAFVAAVLAAVLGVASRIYQKRL